MDFEKLDVPLRSGGGGCGRRKATSKRLRFEVFHRDHFTCQYCGAQPPDVVLVCDHAIPVAKGGLTSAENLVTACESCNAGKSDKTLGDTIVRPDADLMYLNIQQEIAELQRYDQEKERYSLALESAARRIIQDTWFGRFEGDWHPSIRFVSQVIEKYDAHVAEKAIEATAIAFNQGKLNKNGKWFPYTWAVARNANDELYGNAEEVEEESEDSAEMIRNLSEEIEDCYVTIKHLEDSSESFLKWAHFYRCSVEVCRVFLGRHLSFAEMKDVEDQCISYASLVPIRPDWFKERWYCDDLEELTAQEGEIL